MNKQKPWEEDSLEEEFQAQPEPEPVAKYEVLKSFSFGNERIYPGDEVPEGVSEKAMAFLLKKGVVRTL